MTREELRDYVDMQRSLNNIPYHVYSALIDGIDTLEQEPVLDKIRAEIEEYKSRQLTLAIGVKDLEEGKQIALEYVLAILDKYKAERERT